MEGKWPDYTYIIPDKNIPDHKNWSLLNLPLAWCFARVPHSETSTTQWSAENKLMVMRSYLKHFTHRCFEQWDSLSNIYTDKGGSGRSAAPVYVNGLGWERLMAARLHANTLALSEWDRQDGWWLLGFVCFF